MNSLLLFNTPNDIKVSVTFPSFCLNFILTLLNENVLEVIYEQIIRSNKNVKTFTCSSRAWAPELLEDFTFL